MVIETVAAFGRAVRPAVGPAAAMVTASLRSAGGGVLRQSLAGEERLGPDQLANDDDPGLFGPDSATWVVHGDASMVVGGVRALLIQTLHPLAMAGVADHSDYRHDPMGRLHRTGRFIGATTFGNTEVAEAMIDTINRVHTRVVGTASDGRPYAATDPHLLLWVHSTEVDSFLDAHRRYGHRSLTEADQDAYVAEMAEVAVRLGVDPSEVPRSRAELAATLARFGPDLAYGAQARDAVRFLLVPPLPLAGRGLYAMILAAAIGSLPRWAQHKLWLPVLPGVDTLAIRPAATALVRTMDWFLTTDQPNR